jgi:hypothetical protein
MSEKPERIDLRYLTQNADHHYLSADHKWMLWIWRNIVLIKASGMWSVEKTAFYVNQYWDTFKRLRATWPKVYYVLDMNNMEIQTEEFRRYLKENWAHLLDREDLGLCFVEGKAMKRIIWTSIFQLIGKKDRLFLFKDFTDAFDWVRGRFVENGAREK